MIACTPEGSVTVTGCGGPIRPATGMPDTTNVPARPIVTWYDPSVAERVVSTRAPAASVTTTMAPETGRGTHAGSGGLRSTGQTGPAVTTPTMVDGPAADGGAGGVADGDGKADGIGGADAVDSDGEAASEPIPGEPAEIAGGGTDPVPDDTPHPDTTAQPRRTMVSAVRERPGRACGADCRITGTRRLRARTSSGPGDSPLMKQEHVLVHDVRHERVRGPARSERRLSLRQTMSPSPNGAPWQVVRAFT